MDLEQSQGDDELNLITLDHRNVVDFSRFQSIQSRPLPSLEFDLVRLGKDPENSDSFRPCA